MSPTGPIPPIGTRVTVDELQAKSRLTLHPKQMEVYATSSRFKVVVAGRRWGKTQLAKITIIKEAAAKPGRLVWYVAPTYRMAKQIMWEELVSSIPRRWIRKVNETSLTIKLWNGSTIELKGADKPDALRGVGLHYLVLDEFQDMRKETWSKVLRPTLASTRGEAMIIGTPKSFNLLYDLYELGQRDHYRQKGIWTSWQFPTETSPFIPASEIEDARRDMDEKSFRAEFQASFETMAGRVYHAFDRHKHVGTYAFNPTLPLWIGQDFNIDPMSSVLMQVQNNGEIWCVGEIVLFGSNVVEVCEEIERRFWRLPPGQITIYPDPAGGSASHARGESSLDIFREKGFKRIKYRRKHPLIQDRVNAVNAVLMAANGTIRLKIDKQCRHLINALEQTQYKAGTPDVDKTLGVEHSADAIGYPIEIEFPSRRFKPTGISI